MLLSCQYMLTFASANSTGNRPALRARLCDCRLKRTIRGPVFSLILCKATELSAPAVHKKVADRRRDCRPLSECHAYIRSKERHPVSDRAPSSVELAQQQVQHSASEHGSEPLVHVATSSTDLFPSSHANPSSIIEMITFAAYFPFGERDISSQHDSPALHAGLPDF